MAAERYSLVTPLAVQFLRDLAISDVMGRERRGNGRLIVDWAAVAWSILMP
jgi:hypothetical protein